MKAKDPINLPICFLLLFMDLFLFACKSNQKLSFPNWNRKKKRKKKKEKERKQPESCGRVLIYDIFNNLNQIK
jgi:hypothetical protein